MAQDPIEHAERVVNACRGFDGPRVRRAVNQLADLDAWAEDRFAAPETGPKSCLHRLVTVRGGMTLYLNASRGAERSPVHDHLVRAWVAGISGRERSTFHHVKGGRPVAGDTVDIVPGICVEMDRATLHAIEIEEPTRALHLYEKPLEELGGRRWWSEAEERWRPLDLLSPIVDHRT